MIRRTPHLGLIVLWAILALALAWPAVAQETDDDTTDDDITPADDDTAVDDDTSSDDDNDDNDSPEPEDTPDSDTVDAGHQLVVSDGGCGC